MSLLLRKMIDIGPAGVIYPGSAQDYRQHGNRGYFAETRTPWIRMWADWPSLQPDGRYRVDDPASPGYFRLQALDEQIRLAVADGLYVMLMPYRFPTWVNGTAAAAAQKNTDAEIAYEYWDRMTEAVWNRYVRSGRDPSVYNPSRRALEYRLPADPYGPASEWARFLDFLYRRYHYGQRSSGRYVRGFELVNEPNLQLWPLNAPSPTANLFDPGPVTIPAVIAQLMATAQSISGRYSHSTSLYAPSISDSDTASSRRYARWDTFVPQLLDALDARRYARHSGQQWSHHNYSDIEYRTPAASTRLQVVRRALAGRLRGYPASQSPPVFVTRGGRTAEPDAGALPRRGSGAGAGEVPQRRLGAASPGQRRRRRRLDVRAVPPLRRPQLRHGPARSVAVDGQAPVLHGLGRLPPVLLDRLADGRRSLWAAQASRG